MVKRYEKPPPIDPLPECVQCDECGESAGQMCALVENNWTCYKCWIKGPGKRWPEKSVQTERR